MMLHHHVTVEQLMAACMGIRPRKREDGAGWHDIRVAGTMRKPLLSKAY